MKTKICTSIDQSKKLLELGVDVNTADMFYADLFIDNKHKYIVYPLETYGFKTFKDTNKIENTKLKFIPCWSLSSLMNLLPSEFTEVGKYSTTKYEIDIRKYKLTDEVNLHQIAYGNYKFYEDGNSSWKDMINTGEKEDLLDAVFDMIVWLKENKKI